MSAEKVAEGPAPDQVLDDLENLLQEKLELARGDFGRWLDKPGAPEEEAGSDASRGAFYLRFPETQIRAAHHHDLSPDLLIVDPEPGTLALIHILAESEDPEGIGSQVRKLVDDATYLRHLLVTDPARGDRLPWTVELVLVATASKMERRIAATLGDIAGGTSLLHAIGVNLLFRERPFGSLPERQLAGRIRRAFPWLLRATHAWYKSDYASAGGERQGAAGSALAAVELKSYRLPGERTLSLEPGAKVHLLHGHNGSGKSSLVEAMELIMIGTVERIERAEEPDYDQIIRHRGAAEPASIRLCFKDGSQTEPFVVGKPDQPPLAPTLQATSFRLDQTVVDRLTWFGNDERAATFTGAFFPEEVEDRRAFLKARREADASFRALPKEVRESVGGEQLRNEERDEAVVTRSEWLDPDSRAKPSGVFLEDCLPLPRPALEALAPLAPELAEVFAALRKKPPEAGKARHYLDLIDEALERISQPAERRGTVASLRAARTSLEDVGDWIAEGRKEEGEDFPGLVNRWLELCALAELGKKNLQIVEALHRARTAGWQSEGGEVGLFAAAAFDDEEVAELREQSESWARQRKEQFDRVMARQDAGAIAAKKPSNSRPRSLSRQQVDALDTAGRWLFYAADTEEREGLGRSIREALAYDRHVSFARVPIGDSGWAAPLLERLETLEQACRELFGAVDGGEWQGVAERRRNLLEALGSHRRARQAGAKLSRTFLQRIDPLLAEAINELMALFSPARWIYEDIELVLHTTPRGTEHLVLRTVPDGRDTASARADLRFNTAELNLFAVTLFLLCAVRVDNRLRLLVLDDPLENMDELSVTMLARGLAKLARCLPADWKILILFHGEDDLARFRNEVPAAVYFLPWLHHSSVTAEVATEAETEGVLSGEPQDLSSLLAPRP